jgi:spoIIIJ-associated protein
LCARSAEPCHATKGGGPKKKEKLLMEWVETTAKTVEEAREAALDKLGVGAGDAEFEVVEEPRPGLFGRLRGEARIRARVKPEQVRPKQERRRRSKSDRSSSKSSEKGTNPTIGDSANADGKSAGEESSSKESSRSNGTGRGNRNRTSKKSQSQEKRMTNDERPESTVTPQEVGTAAVKFMDGLTAAFGASGTTSLDVDELQLEVNVDGEELGLLVGPSGRTLNAIQDLARVSAQRRLGDHDTRLRIDVAGYRGRREAALGKFAASVAEQVRSSGSPRSLEPMTSADRKIVHDALNTEDGVGSRSEGDDPNRRIIVEPV